MVLLINGAFHECESLDTETDRRARVFLKILKQRLPNHAARDLYIKKMIICSAPGARRIFAVTNSRYCINVNRDHTSQETYYRYSDKYGINQGCWSSNTGEGHKHGACNGTEAREFFQRNAFKITPDMERALFPAPEEPQEPSVRVYGDAKLQKTMEEWYRAQSLLYNKRRFSWFSQNADEEQRASIEESAVDAIMGQ